MIGGVSFLKNRFSISRKYDRLELKKLPERYAAYILNNLDSFLLSDDETWKFII
jgi:hypothetical protein